jgi:hypothetical protein
MNTLKNGYCVAFDLVGYVGKGKTKKKIVQSMDTGIVKLEDVKANVDYYTNNFIEEDDCRKVVNVKVYQIREMSKVEWNKV